MVGRIGDVYSSDQAPLPNCESALARYTTKMHAWSMARGGTTNVRECLVDVLLLDELTYDSNALIQDRVWLVRESSTSKKYCMLGVALCVTCQVGGACVQLVVVPYCGSASPPGIRCS